MLVAVVLYGKDGEVITSRHRCGQEAQEGNTNTKKGKGSHAYDSLRQLRGRVSLCVHTKNLREDRR